MPVLEELKERKCRSPGSAQMIMNGDDLRFELDRESTINRR